MSEFEMVENTRMEPVEVRTERVATNKDKIVSAAADNFDKILNLATDIVELEKMNLQSKAVIAKMAEDRKMLMVEAEAYAVKKQADTDNMIAKMDFIRDMMKDFYQQSNEKITGEEFSKIMTSVINNIDKLETK